MIAVNDNKAKEMGLGEVGGIDKIELNVPDLLQQTVDQTALVTAHNIVDYMVNYISKRDDYNDLKEQYDEIILVLKKIDKRYEVKADAKNNSTLNRDNHK